MPSRLARIVALAGIVVLAACSGGGRPSLSSRQTPTTTTLPANTALIARALVPQLATYATPSAAAPTQNFANPWLLDNDPAHPVPLVLLVRSQQPGWVQLLLPIRPNGTVGWAHAHDVAIEQSPYRITVQLGAHLLTVYNGSSVLLQDTIADGQPMTPTPTGLYYIRVLLKAPDPNTVYGPYAYGLSGHSEVLNTFDGGDAELGIHGNNDPTVLGKSISHGCIRMSNDKITELTSKLPLGTPVQITA